MELEWGEKGGRLLAITGIANLTYEISVFLKGEVPYYKGRLKENCHTRLDVRSVGTTLPDLDLVKEDCQNDWNEMLRNHIGKGEE